MKPVVWEDRGLFAFRAAAAARVSRRFFHLHLGEGLQGLVEWERMCRTTAGGIGFSSRSYGAAAMNTRFGALMVCGGCSFLGGLAANHLFFAPSAIVAHTLPLPPAQFVCLGKIL